MTRLSSAALADPPKSAMATTAAAAAAISVSAVPAPDPPADAQAERARLVRLCAHLTGDLDAAEDLAHEALLVAYRRVDRLESYGPQARWPWLAATARNVCLHWRRDRARDFRRTAHRRGYEHHAGHVVPADATDASSAEETDALDSIPSDVDLSVELERSELATLLDRAMALLPPDTRRVLVERYIEDSAQAQTALRLGLSEGAVAMRLQRGRLALRRILSTDLREDAAAYGLVSPEREDWQPTRIWCPTCGQRRLMGRFYGTGELQLHCWDCLGVAGAQPLGRNRLFDSGRPELFQGVKGFKPALNRQLDTIHATLDRWLVSGRQMARCPRCGTHVARDVYLVNITRIHTSTAYCPSCGFMFGHTSAKAIALARPEGRRFWREHPRMRSVPDQVIEVDGRPAIITRLVSLTGDAELAVVMDRETFRVHEIHGAPRS